NSERLGLLDGPDQRPERADHVEDARDIALVERVHRDVAPDQLGRYVGLQVREGQNEVRLERDDLLEVRRDEGRDARLLAPHARWPHRIARYAHNAVLLAEQIE